MAAWTWCPTAGSSITFTPMVSEAKYGDGYVQRASQGINPITRMFSLTFPAETEEEMKVMTDFLEANAIIGFHFTPPGWPQMFVVSDNWTATYVDKSSKKKLIMTLSVEFRQIYNYPAGGLPP